MHDYYSQDIKRFAKMNHLYLCARHYKDKDILNFCRELFMSTMDRSNIVAFGKTPIVTEIQRLTAWKQQSIERAVREMKNYGEIQKVGHNKIIVNPSFANRMTLVKNNHGYDGLQPIYTAEELLLVKEINKLIKTETQENEMQAMMKQFNLTNKHNEELKHSVDEMKSDISEMKKALKFLISKAKNEDVVEVQTYLRLVKDNEK